MWWRGKIKLANQRPQNPGPSLTHKKGERGEKEKKNSELKKKVFLLEKNKMDLNDLKQNQNGGSRANRRGDTIRELRRMIYPSRGSNSGRGRANRSQNPSRDVPFMTFVQGKYTLMPK